MSRVNLQVQQDGEAVVVFPSHKIDLGVVRLVSVADIDNTRIIKFKSQRGAVIELSMYLDGGENESG